MDKKTIGTVSGVGVGALAAGLILGYVFFDDSAEVQTLQEKAASLQKEKEQAVESLKKECENRVKELQDRLDAAKNELASTRRKLSSELKDARNALAAAQQREAALKEQLDSERNRLQAKVRELQEKMISGPDIPALVDELNHTWPAYIGFTVRSLELRNSLANARVRPPDIEQVKKTARDLLDYAAAYERYVQPLRQHVTTVRPELDKAGIDPAFILKVFSEKTGRFVRGAVEKVNAILDKITTKKGRVEASEGFTDIPIQVQPGDLLFFSYEGSWQISSDRGMGGAEGWSDVPNHMKYAKDAPGGCLVFKVGVSEKVLPAFGDQPKTAPEAGLLRVGINDNVLDDNVGYLDVSVTRIPGRELQEFEDFWTKYIAPVVHWEIPAAK